MKRSVLHVVRFAPHTVGSQMSDVGLRPLSALPSLVMAVVGIASSDELSLHAIRRDADS